MTVSIVLLARLIYLFSALMLLWLSFAAWLRRKRAPKAGIIALLGLCAAVYCFGSSEEISQTSLEGAQFWLHVEYLGLPWIPVFWVSLARKNLQLPNRNGLLLVIPVITFVAQWTNSLHGLFIRSVQFLPRPPFWIVAMRRGPLDYLFLLFLYGSFIYGTWLYGVSFRSISRPFKMQELLFVLSALPPLLGYLFYFFGWSPWNLDIAPLLLTVSVAVAYYAVIRLECFDLVPMARSLVFTSMRDAALVTDLRLHLIDLNPSARTLLSSWGGIQLGQDVIAALPKPLTMRKLFNDQGHAQEIEVYDSGETRHFEARALPLRSGGRQYGWALLLADITARARLLHELRRDAETDELTGVANRRCFMAALEVEYEHSIRHQAAFSVMIVDLDHFKSVNDRSGHMAGDKVLAAVAGRILSCLRRIDLLGRYGGDEFAILLPETGGADALEVAERIRRVVKEMIVDVGDRNIHPSTSIGVASFDAEHHSDWAQLLDEADQALYRVKAEGGNRVASWAEIRVKSH